MSSQGTDRRRFIVSAAATAALFALVRVYPPPVNVRGAKATTPGSS